MVGIHSVVAVLEVEAELGVTGTSLGIRGRVVAKTASVVVVRKMERFLEWTRR